MSRIPCETIKDAKQNYSEEVRDITIRDIADGIYYDYWVDGGEEVDECEGGDNSLGVTVQRNTNNVVSGDKLRKIQADTLSKTANYLSKTYGPMGSNTKIIQGTTQKDVSASYSKDGLKVLSKILNSAPIEASIVEELIEITKAVEKEVGDGTTSTVILSSYMFNALVRIEEEYKIPPYKLMREFRAIADMIKERIAKEGRDCTIEDIYNIAMVSTNGNEEVSQNIADIYKEHGMNVELTAGISNTTDSLVKVYDGLTITEGMSDPVFINNITNNTAEIRNANIYHFSDPIDSADMIALFEAIINTNIYYPLEYNEAPVPTVIVCPRISSDTSAILKQLTTQLYQFDSASAMRKPPILIITNVVASDELIMDDIANLCGCKTIHKYIDKEVYKKDIESGVAPTVETIAENFAGKAEMVVADSKKTKFINPIHMKIYNEDGTIQDDPIYTSMVNFLETEIKESKDSENAAEVGILKRRLSALKANMVDYLVGGITISERDALKDLVEDAIKNCKSAALYGVGYAANYMGLSKSLEIASELYVESVDASEEDEKLANLKYDIAKAFYGSYVDATTVLYRSIDSDINSSERHAKESIVNGKPYDISSGDYAAGDNVLCSIRLDSQVLDTLCRIIGMMITCNQALLMSTTMNVY